MGIFSFLGNIGAGIQGARMGKKQMELGQGMIDEGQSLSAAFKRPEMRTPEAINMMMEISRGRQFQNMPGMTQMQNQIEKATAGGVSAMKEMGTGAEAFGGAAQLHAQALDAQGNLGTQNAQYQDQNQQQHMGALEGLGDWQQQAWGWNEADPYLNAQAKAAELERSGREGQWEGLKNKMGSWATSFQGMGGALDDTASQVSSMLMPWTTGSKVLGAMGGASA